MFLDRSEVPGHAWGAEEATVNRLGEFHFSVQISVSPKFSAPDGSWQNRHPRCARPSSSKCREVPVEAAETLRDASQCLIQSHQHVGSVSGRLQHRGTGPKSPTPSGGFFHDLRDESLLSGNQVVDPSDLLIVRSRNL